MTDAVAVELAGEVRANGVVLLQPKAPIPSGKVRGLE
jgi:hypothetical protein